MMMMRRTAAGVLALLLALQAVPAAHADNQMGYRLLSPREAAGLTNQHGALGMDVGQGQQITSGGMAFEIMRVKAVRPDSPGARAGFNAGDQIIAVDGRVFPNVRAFASYVGSRPPGQPISIDYIPNGGGPDQAERVSVTVGTAGRALPQKAPEEPQSTGMSTRTKIGIGAAALIGCYALGCFSRRQPAAPQR